SGGDVMGRSWLRDGGGWQPRPDTKVSATLFGCGEGERVYYGKQRGQSYFTEAVVEGLEGKAANREGAVTLQALADYVAKRVPQAILEDQGKALPQRPVLVVVPQGGDAVLRPAPKEWVAVLPFEGQAGETVADMVQTRLQQSGTLNLVERLRLSQVVGELRVE
ncbi:MAG: hypothetical protein QHJ73_07825, partial [Armatimonadota bacterium]|nr:hypothetical protein [Armatimonadota bacterium]